MNIEDKYLINESQTIKNIFLQLKGALKELYEYYEQYNHIVPNKKASKNGIELIKLIEKDLNIIKNEFKKG